MRLQDMLQEMARALIISVFFSTVVPFILNQSGFLSGPESFLVAISIFMGSQLLFFGHKTFDVSEKATNMNKVLDEILSIGKKQDEIRPDLWAIDGNFEQAIKSYNSKYPFIIDFYHKKVINIREHLKTIIEKGSVAQVPTSVFAQYSKEIFSVFDHTDEEGNYTNNHYYAVISCEGANEWFGQRTIAKQVLEKIDEKVKDRQKPQKDNKKIPPPITVKRVLIFEPEAINWIERDIFFQLHRESGYDVALISRDDFNNVCVGAYNTLEEDFGIFGGAFVWESTINAETGIKEGAILLNVAKSKQGNTFEQYQTFFDHICGSSKDKYTPHQKIIEYCENKKIYNFRELIRNLPPEIEKLRTTITPPPRP